MIGILSKSGINVEPVHAYWQNRRRLSDAEAVSGWPCHPAYVLGHGNERLSCSFCVLASVNDLRMPSLITLKPITILSNLNNNLVGPFNIIVPFNLYPHPHLLPSLIMQTKCFHHSI
jgi:hypothetical protein